VTLRSRAHLVVLVAGALVVGAAAALLVAIHVNTIALDETIYKASAVHYTSGLPGSLMHDLTARGTARLYSLLIAPLFAVLDGDLAVRWARAFTTALYVASAIPVYLLARLVVRSRWGAVVAALATITAPWLVLTSALFSESLSLLAFCWTLVAMVHALRRPAWWRDVLVMTGLVVLLCTRVQLGALIPAWAIVVVLWQLREARALGLGVWDLGFILRRTLMRYPLTVLGVALVLVVLVALLAEGSLHHRIQVVFGGYSEIQDRTTLPIEPGRAISFEVVAFAVGVGLVPAILALGWLRAALLGRLGREAFDLALLGTILLSVLFAGTVFAQNGYLGVNSEERYYLYVLPLVWIGAVAAWEDGRVTRGWLAASGLGLAVLAATVDVGNVDLNATRFFLAPVAATVNHLSPRLSGDVESVLGVGPGRQVLVVSVVLLAGVVTVLLLRSRWGWAPLALALAVQLGVTVYAFEGTRGGLANVDSRILPMSFHELGWVDRATPGSPPVTWLDSELRVPGFADQERTALFYNDEISSVMKIGPQMLSPVGSPLDALPVVGLAPAGPTTLPAAPTGWFVELRDSPFIQLGGRLAAVDAVGPYELREVGARDRVTWIADSLADDGIVSKQRPARMLAPSGTRATLLLSAPTPAPTSVIVRAGGRRQVVRFARGAGERRVTLRLCAASGAVPVELRAERTTRLPDLRDVSVVVRGVHVTPVRC
jgi:hypothetical protein